MSETCFVEISVYEGPDNKPVDSESKSDTATAVSLQKIALYRLCRPFLIIMRLGGLFFLPTNLEEIRPHNQKRHRVPVKHFISERSRTGNFERVSKWYCIQSFIWVVAYGAKFATNFFTLVLPMKSILSGTNLATFIYYISFGNWHVHLIIIHLIFLRACWKSSLIYDFFMKWETLRYRCSDNRCSAFEEYFKPKRNLLISFTLVVLLAQLLALWLPLMISSSDQYSTIRQIIFAGFGVGNPWATAFMIIGHFYASFVYITPVMFYLLLNFAIHEDFCHLHHDLSEQISEAGTFTGSLEWFRLRHSKLCALIEHTDNIFALFILITIAASIGQLFMLVFVVYEYSRRGLFGIAAALTELFWFFIYLLQPALFFGMGMKINESAHAPLDVLYLLDHAKMTSVEIQQLHTFLNKLTCNRIGYTAWRMFTVDAPALLSMMGIYWTYQILLFQLQLDLDDKVPTTNQTVQS